MHAHRTPRPLRAVLLVLPVAALLAACSSAGGADSDDADALRLGYFPNLAHAPAILGVEDGIFADELGDTTVEPEVIAAGPDAVTALLSDKVDAAFLGPAPALNAFAKSHGGVTLIAGTSSGGVRFVARPEMVASGDLAGAKLASPALGGSPDVALRTWLGTEGYDVDGSGDDAVKVLPQSPGQAVGAYASGAIDGAWMHEPYATLMENEGAEEVLDERDLWPGGRFSTTVLVVRTDYLADHPDVVDGLLAGLLASLDRIEADPAAAEKTVGGFIEEQAGVALDPADLQRAWDTLEFTSDPLLDTIATGLRNAAALDLVDDVDIDDFADLGPLEKLQKATP